MAGSLLAKYGGLLGLGGISTMSKGTISPKFYPKILQSVPYNLQLMNEPITFAKYDTTTTPYHFFQDIYNPSVLGYIAHYTIGLPGVILGLFSSNQPVRHPINLQTIARDTVFNLTAKQWAVINTLQDRVNVQMDQTSGLVILSAEMPDPVAAAELAKAGINILTSYITKYYTRKAVQNLHFLQKQTKQAKQNYAETQQQLAEFLDNNLSLTSASAKARLKNLRSANNLAFSLYNSLRKKTQQAKIMVQKKTPVVSILQPVTVPESTSKPKRKLIVIVFLILGFIVALGWSLVRDYGRDIIHEVRTAEEEQASGNDGQVPPPRRKVQRKR